MPRPATEHEQLDELATRVEHVVDDRPLARRVVHRRQDLGEVRELCVGIPHDPLHDRAQRDEINVHRLQLGVGCRIRAERACRVRRRRVHAVRRRRRHRRVARREHPIRGVPSDRVDAVHGCRRDDAGGRGRLGRPCDMRMSSLGRHARLAGAPCATVESRESRLGPATA